MEQQRRAVLADAKLEHLPDEDLVIASGVRGVQATVEVEKAYFGGNQKAVAARPVVPHPSHGGPQSPERPVGATSGIGAEIKAIGPSLPKPFLITDVVERLQKQGFDFGSRFPADAVRDALYLQVKSKQNPSFKIVEQGVAGKPSKFQYIGN